MFLLSKKTLFSIESNLETILNGTFDERNIKMLLVDIREVGKDFKAQVYDMSKDALINPCLDALDICDFIFHSHRDYGVLEKNQRSTINKINDIFETSKLDSIPDWSVEKFTNIDSIVVGLLALVTLYLNKFKTTFNREKLLKILIENKNEIGLCIISLLQDAVIKNKKGLEGVLYIYAYEGKYRVYCRAFNTKIDQNIKKKLNKNNGGVFFGFPVIDSQIENKDEVEFNDNLLITQLVETYRDNKGTLRLRKIKRYFNNEGNPLRRFKSSVFEIYNLLVNGSFKESDIKELFIDLREHAEYLLKETKQISPNPRSFDQSLGSFIEICKYIAHQNRTDQGLIERNINEHLLALENALTQGKIDEINNKQVQNVIDANSIVLGLNIVVDHYLRTYGIDVNKSNWIKIAEHIDDISLCIISLLHEYSVKLNDWNSRAIFHVHCHDNKYHLYCRIFGSRLESYFTERDKNKPFVIGFPVVITNAQNIDSLVIEENSTDQKCIETYRDSFGVLRTRFKAESF